MGIPKKPVLFMLIVTAVIMLCFLFLQPFLIGLFQEEIAVLFPKGWVGLEQRNLLLIIQGLMLLIIIPVYILTFVFSWVYRADNKKATYDPDLVDHTIAEYVWWGLPLLMIIIIGWITYVKTYELDPYKPIQSDQQPLRIEVVALPWKWLFIYPEEKIATVNTLQIPVNRPIHFEITADAPMNSFWIPQLGGQIYAMPGMKTELNLIANEAGEYRGSSANISGEGFSGMYFQTHAVSPEDFQKWVGEAQKVKNPLDAKVYQTLSAPSQNNSVEHFQLNDEQLFHQILMKYMLPPKE